MIAPVSIKRLDHSLVGVALLSLVVDHTFAGEAWGLLGESTILIDSVRDRRIDAARFQHGAVCGPDLEVFAAMTGRGMNEAGAGVFSDMITG